MNKTYDVNRDKYLGISVMLISLVFSMLFLIISFFMDNNVNGISFFVGSLSMVIYLRMQIIFGNTIGKRDLFSVLLLALSSGRIVLLGMILYLTAKRVDIFNVYYTVLGLSFTLTISFILLIYNSFKLEKTVTPNILNVKLEG